MAISFMAAILAATVVLVPKNGTIEKTQVKIPLGSESKNEKRISVNKKEEKIILRKSKSSKKKSGKKSASDFENENLNKIYKKEREYFRKGKSKSKKASRVVSGPLAAIPTAVANAIAINIANARIKENSPPPPSRKTSGHHETLEEILNVEDAKPKKKLSSKDKKNEKKDYKSKPKKKYTHKKKSTPKNVKQELASEMHLASSKASTDTRHLAAIKVDTKGLLKRIEKKYTSYYVKADIKSEVTQSLLDRTKSYSGTLYLAPKGRFKMDIKEPNRHMLLMNGKNIWVVDYPLDESQDKVQILHSKSAKNLKNQAFLDIFSGVGKLQKKFKIESSDKDSDEIIYKLIPKKKDAQIEKVELQVDAQSELISSIAFWDSLGNKTELKLSEQEFESKVPSKVFKFKPPKNSSITYL